MKILIAADMEGITGVLNWDHVDPTHSEYSRFRKIMTEDVNAAISGAFNGGATEVLVADGHSHGTNIIIENLDPRAKLNGSNTSPFAMMQGIDRTIDGVIFVGYHARMGSENAICDHTWSSSTVANLWLNNILVGEYGLNGALAGYFGVPVIMLTGDQTACAQAKELLGPIETAVVKVASGRYSAECLPPKISFKLISDCAERAVENLRSVNKPKPFILKSPVQVSVGFINSHQADSATKLPGASRNSNRVSIEAVDMKTAYQAFRALVELGQKQY